MRLQSDIDWMWVNHLHKVKSWQSFRQSSFVATFSTTCEKLLFSWPKIKIFHCIIVKLRGLDSTVLKSRSRQLRKSWQLKKNWSWRSRNLNLVSTPPSSPKSLNPDWESFDSLSQFRLRVSLFYHFPWSGFFNLSRSLRLKSLKYSIVSRFLDKSWQILISLNNLD